MSCDSPCVSLIGKGNRFVVFKHRELKHFNPDFFLQLDQLMIEWRISLIQHFLLAVAVKGPRLYYIQYYTIPSAVFKDRRRQDHRDKL